MQKYLLPGVTLLAKTYSYLYEAANRKGGLTFAKTTFQQALMDAVQEEADKYVAKDADSNNTGDGFHVPK